VHTLAGPSKVWGRRLSERVHARVYIVVEVVGCYVGENEQPAVNRINELMKKNKIERQHADLVLSYLPFIISHFY
jgi:hypothetical protein